MSSDLAAEPHNRPQGTEGADHDRVRTADMAVGVIVARTAEQFDFFVYAIASVLVFPRHFFPFADAVTGMAYSFVIFALAFLARPIGTVIFMGLERHFGRAVKLTIALFLLGGSTMSFAFIPGYADIGVYSVMLLAFLRIIQGLAQGGSWDGLPTLLAINAPAGRKGTYAMIPQLGAPFGLIVASILFEFFYANLSPSDFFDWGWRYPFYSAFAINVVALFARLRMVAAQEYADLFESRDLEPSPLVETLRHEWRNILIGALAPLGTFALFHMVSVFPLTWLVLFSDYDRSRLLIVLLIGALFCSLTMIGSGPLADRVGRRNLLGMMTIFIGAFSLFGPPLLYAGEAGVSAFIILGFALLGLSYGQIAGALATRFQMRYRYTSSALTADMAWLFGAGFAPLVALLLTYQFGLLASGLYLLSGAVCSGIMLLLDRQSSSGD